MVENGGEFVSSRKRKEMAASSRIPVLDRNVLIGNVEPTCSTSSISSVKNRHRYGNNSAKRICLERRTIGKEDMISNCSSSFKSLSETGSIRMTDEMSLKSLPS
ncbi:uncharacterized protein LOC110026130 [Phalaenopsis equestris]|uniref:uncharacterized protein LOC110026130 n=1 Tax=Phalaenopsis equestris TaxID=78828 RepID=UPI0009E1AD09|nr:uncharacterized protein LOC110026130 [Phalaenopsis equestris]XP_020582620.1 uncharacterized protein LOC110026130 [Phalaenopsis equestris]